MISILARARDLNRRIYASFPWGYRVAQVILHLASSLTDNVGRALYAEFLKAGVEGMPAVTGVEPGAVVKPERLPPNYGRRFGETLYANVLRKVRDPEIVEDVLQDVLVKMLRGKIKVKEGAAIREAESYIHSTALRMAIDRIRRDTGNRTDHKNKVHLIPLQDEQTNADGYTTERVITDLSDPDAFRDLNTLLPRRDLENMMHELERLEPRAASWLEGKLDGSKSFEIAADWGISASRMSQWESANLPKIKAILNKYLQSAA